MLHTVFCTPERVKETLGADSDFAPFSLKALIAEARRLARKHRDVTYNASPCYYTMGRCSNDRIGCIFGQALLNVGLPRSVLALLDGNDETRPTYTVSSALPALFAFPAYPYAKIIDSAVEWADVIQLYQDRGKTWGEALAAANERYPSVAGRAVLALRPTASETGFCASESVDGGMSFHPLPFDPRPRKEWRRYAREQGYKLREVRPEKYAVKCS